MADGITFDTSELDRLAADLESVLPNSGPYFRAAIEFTAFRIKRGAQAKVRRRHKRFRGGARAIDYELKHFQGFGSTVLEAEVGYDKGKGGAIGSLIEFGAPGAPNAVTPGNELVETLREEEDDFVEGIRKAGQDALDEALAGSTIRGNARQILRGGLR